MSYLMPKSTFPYIPREPHYQENQTTYLVRRFGLRHQGNELHIARLLQEKVRFQEEGKSDSAEYHRTVETLFRYVMHMAHLEAKKMYNKVAPKHLTFDDLFHEACLGALIAIQKHNGTTKLATYVYKAIRTSLWNALEKEGTIRIAPKIWSTKRKIDSLFETHGRHTDLDQMYELYIEKYESEQEVQTSLDIFLRRIDLPLVMSEHVNGADGNEISLFDQVHVEGKEKEIEEEMYIDWLCSLLGTLVSKHSRTPEKDLDILNQVYRKEVTYDQVGSTYGVTRARVEQIVKRYTTLLKHRFKSHIEL